MLKWRQINRHGDDCHVIVKLENTNVKGYPSTMSSNKWAFFACIFSIPKHFTSDLVAQQGLLKMHADIKWASGVALENDMAVPGVQKLHS